MPTLVTRGPSHNLTAQCLAAGEDLLVLVTGGEKPHIGAVAAAAPRQSLADPGRTSASTSVICYMGHKEDELARNLAQALSAALGVRVVVAAGMHWDGLGPEGIEAVGRNVESLLGLILDTAKNGGVAPFN